MAIAYKFSAFNDDKLTATCDSWTKESAQGLAFPSDIEQLLNWVKTHQTIQQGDSTAHGIFLDGVDVADGIVEVVVTKIGKSSKWVKMLRMRLKPSIEERIYQKDIEAQSEAMQIFMAAVVGVARLTGLHSAKTLKIFGRSNDQLAFLQSLALEIQKKIKNATVEIQGRWLVVNV
jgi:hypothetical protein